MNIIIKIIQKLGDLILLSMPTRKVEGAHDRVRAKQVTCMGASSSLSQGHGHTVEPLYKGHFSNEGTVCSPNCVELCTNLPLN